jgi:pimeloyl-ACP methyl ester carboxylesterase
VREHHIRSADGTRILAWRTVTDGPDVLLCPGLGTMPEAWPTLFGPDPGVRVHSWYHRGTLGSDRPSDETRITLDDHLADALAVLADADIGPVVVMGWSAGVAVACELARRYPDLVAGLLLVAGTPGDVFGGVLGLRDLPPKVRAALTEALARTGDRLADSAGPLVNAVLRRLPVNTLTATAVRHSGLMRPTSDTADVVRAGRRFQRHDFGWYAKLALALVVEPPRPIVGIHCPVTLLIGRHDPLAGSRQAMAGLAGLPQTRVRTLPASHFLPLEQPDELAEELARLIERADAVRAAQYWRVPPTPVTTGSHQTLTPSHLP